MVKGLERLGDVLFTEPEIFVKVKVKQVKSKVMRLRANPHVPNEKVAEVEDFRADHEEWISLNDFKKLVGGK